MLVDKFVIFKLFLDNFLNTFRVFIASLSDLMQLMMSHRRFPVCYYTHNSVI